MNNDRKRNEELPDPPSFMEALRSTMEPSNPRKLVIPGSSEPKFLESCLGLVIVVGLIALLLLILFLAFMMH